MLSGCTLNSREDVHVDDLSVMIGTYEFLDTVDHANMQFISASEYTNHPQYINAENGKYIVIKGNPRSQSKKVYMRCDISINIIRITLVSIISLISNQLVVPGKQLKLSKI